MNTIQEQIDDKEENRQIRGKSSGGIRDLKITKKTRWDNIEEESLVSTFWKY